MIKGKDEKGNENVKRKRERKNMITRDEDMKTEKIMIKGKDEKYDERVK